METARRTVVFFVIIAFMVSDVAVISNLFSYALNGTNAGPLQMLSNVMFMIMLDFVPIFAVTPALTKIVRGILSRDTDPYDFRAKVISIFAGTFLFISVATVYCVISVNNPERFLVNASASNDAGFDINQVTTSIGMNLTHDNSELLSIIFGLWPFLTTLTSSIIKFLDIGNKDIENEIRKCKKEIEEKQTDIEVKEIELNRVEKANTILDNMNAEVAAIKERIKTYLEKEKEVKAATEENEDSVYSNIKVGIRNDVLTKFGDVKMRGEEKFNKVHLGRAESSANWRAFMNQSEARIREEIAK